MRNVGRRVSCHSYSMELLSIYSELCARVKSASPNSIKCPWYWKVEERETLMSKQVWQYNFLFKFWCDCYSFSFQRYVLTSWYIYRIFLLREKFDKRKKFTAYFTQMNIVFELASIDALHCFTNFTLRSKV